MRSYSERAAVAVAAEELPRAVPRRVSGPQDEASQIEASQIEASQIEASQIEASQIEASQIEASQNEASRDEGTANRSVANRSVANRSVANRSVGMRSERAANRSAEAVLEAAQVEVESRARGVLWHRLLGDEQEIRCHAERDQTNPQ